MFPQHVFEHTDAPGALEQALVKEVAPDIVLSIGWSWRFPAAVTEATMVVGVHPSDLPRFAGGSPIQHQILAGVTHSQNTLFRITDRLDAGPIIARIPLRLDGHIDEIFLRLTQTSIVLFSNFLLSFPDVAYLPQKASEPLRRLKPESGRLTPADFQQMSTRQLYDAIRCREDPYPNAYIEDSVGILRFKRADFEEFK
jgi:methionyl-tRNA formyltransferase